MKRSNTLQNFLFATLTCALAVASNAAYAAAARVVFAAGDVTVERAGQSSPLAKGADLEQGDTIITGADGRVQFRMTDGDFMALRPNTRLKIDQYKSPRSATQPESGVSFFSLLKGGFRAVTHSLDRRGKDSYRVKTPVATIGIRGTKYSSLFCAGDCPNTPNGLHLGVSDGGINASNKGGSTDYSAGEYGFVKDENTPPAKVPGPPSGFENGGGGGGTQDDDEGDDGYTGGSPPQGCTNPMAGDVNCPPTQPITGDGHDFTGGHLPTGPTGPTGPSGPFEEIPR